MSRERSSSQGGTSSAPRSAFEVLMRAASSPGSGKRKRKGGGSGGGTPAKRAAFGGARSPHAPSSSTGSQAPPAAAQQPHEQRAQSPQAPADPQAQAEARAAFMRALSGAPRPARQSFSHLLVIDLEATCNQARSLQPVEIIELSCVMLEAVSGKAVAEFQSYVRPTEHPRLDPFCSELTGIGQPQVDRAPLLAEALPSFEAWLCGLGVPLGGCVAASWTSWDLEVALAMECKWRGLQVHPLLGAWVDLKRAYTRHYKRRGNLRTCVEAAGLTWSGRAHSGIDDARNEAALAAHLMTRGVRLEVTGRFPEGAPHIRRGGGQQGGAAASSAGRQTGAAAVGGGRQQGAAVVSGGGQQAGAAAADGGVQQVGGQQGPAAAGGRRQALLAPLAPAKPAATRDAAGKWLGVCECGVLAAERFTKKPGPNHGRAFYSCGNWRMARATKQSCSFFMWKDGVRQ